VGIHPINVYVTTYISDTSGAQAGFVPDTVTGYFLDVELATGIPAFVLENEFSLGKIFPNPAMRDVAIPFYIPSSQTVSISVLDLEGRICFEKTISGKRGYNKELLDISSLNDGAYFVRVKNFCSSLFSKIQILKN
jgi:hypothetical protein